MRLSLLKGDSGVCGMIGASEGVEGVEDEEGGVEVGRFRQGRCARRAGYSRVSQQ